MNILTKDTNLPIEITDHVLGCEYNHGLVHQAVVAYMNRARSGNSAQKTRAEVRGGGRKPWKQKGTGRARAGTIRSPIWRGGGVTFAAKKRDYTQKINKKMYKLAIRSILSELYRNEALSIISELECKTHKTKDFLQKMQNLNVKNALIVTDIVTEEMYLASRNLYEYGICESNSIDPVNLLAYEQVIFTEKAIKGLEDQLR